MDTRANLLDALRRTVAAVQALGLVEVKQAPGRDPREPHREEKEAMERALMRWAARHFKRQAEQIRPRLEGAFPGRKAVYPPIDDIFDLADDEDAADLIRILTAGVKQGIDFFGEVVQLGLDWTKANTQAAEWVRKYAFDLIKNIDDTTKEALSRAIDNFVNTPGFTIGDIMDALPFDESRRLMIAQTETTRAYAQGQRMAGEELKKEFPDVKIIKTWFSNADELVCPLCGALDGKEVEVDEHFYEPDGYSDGDPPRHPRCRCWMDTGTKINA